MPTRQEYTVGRGDVLQIVVRKEPELSRDVIVRLDGWITVPLLGDLQAEGQTPKQISEEITRGLARLINTPLVTVAVGQASERPRLRDWPGCSLRRDPAVCPHYRRPSTGAVRGLQGIRQEGLDPDRGSRQEGDPFDFKKFETGRDLEQNVTLKPGDTIVVP